MKKILLVFVLLVTVVALASCGARTYEIAMITDSGDIDDRSFNQGTWEGIVEFAEANSKTYKYYKPTEISFDAYVAAIELAVKGGAKVVITPGFLFENSVHKAQTLFPDVMFVIIDGAPHNVNNWGTMGTYDDAAPDFTIADNTLSIFFQEEQSGFLAGYASVKEGLTSLGFMGGMAVPAVVRFGIGYVAGAYYAAKENNLTNFNFAPNRYLYLNSFAPSDSTKTTAAAWYSAGTQAIHAAAGGAGNSVMAAAQETTGKWVVGVDVDQSNLSARVLTSAMKGLGVSVQAALEDFYNDDFDGGRSITLGVSEDAVGLPTVAASWRFTTFTTAQYSTIVTKLDNGTVVVPTNRAQLTTFLAGLYPTGDFAALLEVISPTPAA
ncbi:MAG: BMP family ABC transporter substrate-binding protein [Acholeplasmataceae bacterium]|nr:BMP family ABC transporter substrate-binding protein [Acholeplasmataceae bacterium]